MGKVEAAGVEAMQHAVPEVTAMSQEVLTAVLPNQAYLLAANNIRLRGFRARAKQSWSTNRLGCMCGKKISRRLYTRSSRLSKRFRLQIVCYSMDDFEA